MPQPSVIDLYPSEIEPDGTCVYRPPLQALAAQVAGGVIWLLTEYPQEALDILTLALIASTFVWLCKKV
jgi:hypothetical protein